MTGADITAAQETDVERGARRPVDRRDFYVERGYQTDDETDASCCSCWAPWARC